jgi:prepilin-type N-terminal cleavage/methylation domain-containing protein
MHDAPRHPSRNGFTLVELVIVVAILGILAAIVVPRFAAGRQEATEAALATNVRNVRIQITKYMADHGDYPRTIEPDWFAGGKLPEHPDNSFGVPTLQVQKDPGRLHPGQKVLKPGLGGAYWYNPLEGTFAARVADQGSQAETLASYNRVNQSSETSLGNYRS